MTGKLIYSGKDDQDFAQSKSEARFAFAAEPEASDNRTLVAQLPFAYGLTDDPESRALKAVEGDQ